MSHEEPITISMGIAQQAAKLITQGTESELSQAITSCEKALALISIEKEPHAASELLSLRGLARVQQYEFHLELAILDEGISDLRKSLTLPFASNAQRQNTESSLATALVRAGEQEGHVSLLREALKRFDVLIAQRGSLGLTAQEDMSCAIAWLRIGSHTGDRAAVQKSCDMLKDQIRGAKDDPPHLSRLAGNLATALLVNAQQLRSIRVYRELIDTLSDHIDPSSTNAVMLLRHRGSARQELADLNGDLSLVESAIEDFEQALSIQGTGSLDTVEILHSLAQSHFRWACLERDTRQTSAAIDRINEAIYIVENSIKKGDARMARLLSARAAYRFADATLSQDKSDVEKAAFDYEQALALVKPHQAPAFYAQIGCGLFLLRTRQKQWQQALDVFDRIESAWQITILDRELSHETYTQRAGDLAGQHARAALCCLALGRGDEAAVFIDRGRATGLSVKIDAPGPIQERASTHELDRAFKHWQKSRREADDEGCRQAWLALLDKRRRHGYEGAPDQWSPDDLFAAVPSDTAVVQILSIEGEVFLLLFDQSGLLAKPLRLGTAHQPVSNLLYGPSSKDGYWTEEYRIVHEISEEAGFYRWGGFLEHALAVLGQTLMQPLHELLSQTKSTHDIIMLSPPGEIFALPLLSATLKDGTPFNQHWSATVIPSVSTLSQRQETPDNDSKAVHALVVSEPASHWSETSNLPEAAREANQVASKFKSHQQLKGSEATLANVLDELEQANYVHFATHGYYNEDRPGESGVVLANRTVLTINRLYSTVQRQTPIRLVFFSCCESGIAGRSFPNDEYLGLLPTMLRYGAETVIGTLWAVYDDSARIFVEHFYRVLLDASGKIKQTPTVAMRETQMWLRKVTVDELLTHDYLTEKQALKLSQQRFKHTRLRKKLSGPNSDAESNGNTVVESDYLLAPFSSPVDWAAFVLLGLPVQGCDID